VLDVCSSVIGGVAQAGDNLECLEFSVPTVLHITEVQGSPAIWGRFGGGSDRNRALLGTKGSSMHGMQFAQICINTGDCASR
jgi:hypothetical protein